MEDIRKDVNFCDHSLLIELRIQECSELRHLNSISESESSRFAGVWL